MNTPSFPKLDNKEFWWLIGYLQGDGSVIKANGTVRITAYSTDMNLIRCVEGVFSRLFALKVGLQKAKNKKNECGAVYVCSKMLYQRFRDLGLRFGAFRWNVPILPPDLFFPYIAGLFDAEGCIHLKNRKKGKVLDRIELSSMNVASLYDIKELLRRNCVVAEISYHKDSKGNRQKAQYVLYVCGRKNLRAFIEKIRTYCRSARASKLDTNNLPSSKTGRPRKCV